MACLSRKSFENEMHEVETISVEFLNWIQHQDKTDEFALSNNHNPQIEFKPNFSEETSRQSIVGTKRIKKWNSSFSILVYI